MHTFDRFVVAVMVAAMAASGRAQSFGLPLMKSKTTLERKLPAIMQLPGTTLKIVATSHVNVPQLADDFRAMLGAELVKDNPRLSIEDGATDSVVDCLITEFDHPPASNGTRPGTPTGKGESKPVNYTRVTGMMRVTFHVRDRAGRSLGSDNIKAQYDEEFQIDGSMLAGGVTSLKHGFMRLSGKGKTADLNPPTDSELRNKLMDTAVQRIAMQLVNTRETVEVLLAKGKGMEEGVKDAEAGLWSRALESWSTMTPLPKPVDDAYRLYDVGVAYEAEGYAAQDAQAAMKFLEEASTDYGKAIDSNPGERYFLEPQRRIELALAHYQKLEDQKKAAAESAAAAQRQAAAQKQAAASPSTSSSTHKKRSK